VRNAAWITNLGERQKLPSVKMTDSSFFHWLGQVRSRTVTISISPSAR
jgi:hypothetical protein